MLSNLLKIGDKSGKVVRKIGKNRDFHMVIIYMCICRFRFIPNLTWKYGSLSTQLRWGWVEHGGFL